MKVLALGSQSGLVTCSYTGLGRSEPSGSERTRVFDHPCLVDSEDVARPTEIVGGLLNTRFALTFCCSPW